MPIIALMTGKECTYLSACSIRHFFITSPIYVSLMPYPYKAAVSISFTPRSIAPLIISTASSSLSGCSRVACPPSPNKLTSYPVYPNVRFGMVLEVIRAASFSACAMVVVFDNRPIPAAVASPFLIKVLRSLSLLIRHSLYKFSSVSTE